MKLQNKETHLVSDGKEWNLYLGLRKKDVGGEGETEEIEKEWVGMKNLEDMIKRREW